ncbi:TadE/TadG family type IV pilus assembly protein [Streptomyces polyrhachis]|uniref:TadE/TadG family type IV pilus assembly protein n=1 Tax=Streptomyces polyrhachis TaxID=1282885 RepID=A0ABW2GCZ3_9ACTN
MARERTRIPGVPRTRGAGRGRRERRRRDAGQVSVEFLGMTPLILTVLVLLWQFVLVGYTYTLAGHAADEAARAAAVEPFYARGTAARAAVLEDLPDAWSVGGVGVDESDPQLVKVRVALSVPVLFPGVDFPWGHVTGTAGAVRED